MPIYLKKILYKILEIKKKYENYKKLLFKYSINNNIMFFIILIIIFS